MKQLVYHTSTDSVSNVSEPSDRSQFFGKPFMQLLLVGCIAMLAGCQANTHESLAKQQVKAMEEFADILDSVKDKRTATVAAPKLKRIAKRMKKIKERAEKLPPPTPEQAQKIAQTHLQSMKRMNSLMTFPMRMMNQPEAMAILEEALEEFRDNR